MAITVAHHAAPATKAAKPTRPTLVPPTVAVNGVVIAADAIAREAQNHSAAAPSQALSEAARALVVRELLLQEARRLGIEATPIEVEEGQIETAEEASIRALLDQEVVTPTADEASCRRFHEQNLRRFRSADLFEVAHILLPAAPDDREARSAASARARSIIADLGAEPAAFAAMAKSFSACPSAANGGNLGQIGPGQTVAEFERALSTMAPGKVHPEPVPSRYGIHIVRVDRRIEGRQLPYPLVADKIAAYLDDTVRQRAYRQYLGMLAGRATIAGVDLEGRASPLVQ